MELREELEKILVMYARLYRQDVVFKTDKDTMIKSLEENTKAIINRLHDLGYGKIGKCLNSNKSCYKSEYSFCVEDCDEQFQPIERIK
jgi:hypothetical protein